MRRPITVFTLAALSLAPALASAHETPRQTSPHAQRPARIARATPSTAVGTAKPASPTMVELRIDFGMKLDCEECGWFYGPGGALTWYSQDPVAVESVQPGGPADQAGLRPGDLLLKVDGLALSAPEGGRYLGAVSPGQRVTLQVRRDGEVLDLGITPRAPVQPQRPL